MCLYLPPLIFSLFSPVTLSAPATVPVPAPTPIQLSVDPGSVRRFLRFLDHEVNLCLILLRLGTPSLLRSNLFIEQPMVRCAGIDPEGFRQLLPISSFFVRFDYPLPVRDGDLVVDHLESCSFKGGRGPRRGR